MNLRSGRSRLLLVATGCATVISGLVLLVFQIDEPSHEGRSLSEWIAIHRGRGQPTPGDVDRQRAALAIRAIGTNALPSLLNWIDYEPSKPRREIQHHVANAPSWIRDSRIGQSLEDPESEERASDAIEAFAALGSIAIPAIPELERRARLAGSRNRSYAALSALASIGNDSVSAMTNALAEPWGRSRWELVWCVRKMGTNGLAVVPALLSNLTHPDWHVVATTASALGHLRLGAEKTVPALIRCLSHGEGEVRSVASEALGNYGSLAESALPALTNILNDSKFSVRYSASNAIWEITTKSQNAVEANGALDN